MTKKKLKIFMRKICRFLKTKLPETDVKNDSIWPSTLNKHSIQKLNLFNIDFF